MKSYGFCGCCNKVIDNWNYHWIKNSRICEWCYKRMKEYDED